MSDNATPTAVPPGSNTKGDSEWKAILSPQQVSAYLPSYHERAAADIYDDLVSSHPAKGHGGASNGQAGQILRGWCLYLRCLRCTLVCKQDEIQQRMWMACILRRYVDVLR